MNLQNQISLTRSELIITLLIFVLTFSAVLTSRLTRLTTDSALLFEESTEILIEEPTDLAKLHTILDGLQVEYDHDEMDWAARLLGWKKFQKGRYVFEESYSYNGFLSKMARGIQDPVPVVILPGTTIERLADGIGGKLSFGADEFKKVFTDSSFLAEKNLSKEQLFGRMLPETYLIYWTSIPEGAINKILREFDRAITPEFKERAEDLGMSIDEVITLASIVEWEAKNAEEKPRISGLYWNRLNRGMLLQADPTVNYAVGERRRLLYEDYLIDHPFNTYKNKGLPPGPITNPDISSIEAVLYPEDHDYLYMVANPEGGHVFTRTFREHQVQSEKWRIWLREQYRIKRQREAEKESADSANS